jgi:hypothetical protein
LRVPRAHAEHTAIIARAPCAARCTRGIAHRRQPRDGAIGARRADAGTMRNTTTSKKLSISPTTIRQLDRRDLVHAAGGTGATNEQGCAERGTYTCGSCGCVTRVR